MRYLSLDRNEIQGLKCQNRDPVLYKYVDGTVFEFAEAKIGTLMPFFVKKTMIIISEMCCY